MNNPIKLAFDRRFSAIEMDETRLEKLSQAASAKTPGARPIKRALVLALSLLLVIGAAYSADLFLGIIDWQGNEIPPETEVMPTWTPNDTTGSSAEALERLAHEALSSKPPEELWLAQVEDSWTSYFPKIRVNDFEQAQKLLRESGSPLMLPDRLPPDYTFSAGELSLYVGTEYHEALTWLGEEIPEPGLTLRGYRLPPEAMGDFSGYLLHFVNKKGETLRLEARLSGGGEDFGLWQGDSYQALDIPGFQRALILERSSGRQVFAQQTGFVPISACGRDYFTRGEDTPENYPLEPEILSDVTYTLYATALSGEEMTALAAQFK